MGGEVGRAAQGRWEDVVKGAEKEGEVTVYATNSVGDLQVIWDAFEKNFPRLKLNSVAISTTSEIVTKVMAERRASQYLVDVVLGAPGATYNSLQRGKALDPMPPALLLPEVTDLSKWWKGKHRYVDPEGQYVFVYQSSLYGPPVYSNTKLVNLDTIRSVWDLLDPKWKGKIIALWPRANYVSTALLFMYHHPQIGPKFLERFYTEMDLTYFSDFRQGTDWLAGGKYPLCFLCRLRRAHGARAAGRRGEPVSFQRSSRHRLQQWRYRLDEFPTAPERGEGFYQLVSVARGADRVPSGQQYPGRRHHDFDARGLAIERRTGSGAAA